MQDSLYEVGSAVRAVILADAELDAPERAVRHDAVSRDCGCRCSVIHSRLVEAHRGGAETRVLPRAAVVARRPPVHVTQFLLLCGRVVSVV